LRDAIANVAQRATERFLDEELMWCARACTCALQRASNKIDIVAKKKHIAITTRAAERARR
jgi:hypothetical protein